MKPKQYRKKPVVIDAIMLTEENLEQVSEWCGGSMWIAPDPFTAPLVIPTLEGGHEAHFGDWIIRGIVGEFYPCRNDIFEKTYEAVQ